MEYTQFYLCCLYFIKSVCTQTTHTCKCAHIYCDVLRERITRWQMLHDNGTRTILLFCHCVRLSLFGVYRRQRTLYTSIYTTKCALRTYCLLSCWNYIRWLLSLCFGCSWCCCCCCCFFRQRWWWCWWWLVDVVCRWWWMWSSAIISCCEMQP